MLLRHKMQLPQAGPHTYSGPEDGHSHCLGLVIPGESDDKHARYLPESACFCPIVGFDAADASQVMWNVESRYGPVIEVFEVEGTRERRLVIGYKMGGTSNFFRCV